MNVYIPLCFLVLLPFFFYQNEQFGILGNEKEKKRIEAE